MLLSLDDLPAVAVVAEAIRSRKVSSYSTSA